MFSAGRLEKGFGTSPRPHQLCTPLPYLLGAFRCAPHKRLFDARSGHAWWGRDAKIQPPRLHGGVEERRCDQPGGLRRSAVAWREEGVSMACALSAATRRRQGRCAQAGIHEPLREGSFDLKRGDTYRAASLAALSGLESFPLVAWPVWEARSARFGKRLGPGRRLPCAPCPPPAPLPTRRPSVPPRKARKSCTTLNPQPDPSRCTPLPHMHVTRSLSGTDGQRATRF